MLVAGQHLPSTLLSRSATEFELECETDAVFEKLAQPADSTAAIASSATDLMSGGILVASSSLNGVDDDTDVTDSSSVLNASSASATTKVATEDILPHLKHKRSYNTKVYHSVHI